MRRVLKIALITVAAAVLLVVGSGALLLALMSDDDYRDLAAYLVERATGRTLVVDGRFAVHPSLRPSLVMSDVRIPNPAWASESDLAQIGHMEIAIALGPLLSGTLVVERLILNDATFALERSADGQDNWAVRADGGGDRMFGRLVPIFGTVRLRDVDWRYRDDASGRDTSVSLAHLTLEEGEGTARLDAAGVWDGQQITANGTFGTLAEALAPIKPFPVDLRVALPGLDLGASGTIAEPANGRGLDLHVVGHAADIAPFLHLLDRAPALAGRLDGEATLGGDLDAVHVADLQISVGRASGKPAIQAKGQIGTVRLGGTPLLDGIAVQLQAELPVAALSDWLGRPLPGLGEVRGQLTLGGTSEVLNVSSVKLETGDGQPTVMSVRGDIAQIHPAVDWSVRGVDLQIEAKADDLAALEPALGVPLRQLGAFSYAGRLAGDSGKWQLSGKARLGETAIEQKFTGNLENDPARLSGELVLTLAGLEVNAHGTIGEATADQSVDLHVVARSDDVAEFLALLGRQASPATRLTAEAALHGAFEALQVADLQLTLDPASGSGQPMLQATGTLGTVRPGGTPPLDGIALQVQGATSTTALSGWLGRPLPDLGAVQGAFRLTGTSDAVRVTAMALQAGADDGLTITANGSIAAIRPARDLALQGVDLRLDMKAPKPSAIGGLLDVALPPLGALAYAGRLSGGGDKWALAGKLHVGRTVIDQDLTGSFDGPRPRFAGKLSTPALHLADFGVAANDAPHEDGTPLADTAVSDLARSYGSLGALDAVDLDLTIDIDRVEGTKLAIGGGEVDLTLQDRVLRVDPARFDLSAGTVLAHATADARVQPPRLDLSLHVDDVQLGQFLMAMGTTTPITGELALILKLESRADPAEGLTPSLDGDASFAIQRGDVDLSVNLATADLVTWLLAGAQQGTNLLRGRRAGGRTTLDCLAGRFELDRGVATAQSLLMQTPLTLSTATGTVDLVDQTIDLVVHLRARRGSVFDPATVYRVRGPMDDPTVDFSKTGFVARAIAGLVMKPIDALGALLPLVADGGRDPTNPCLQ